MDFPDKLVILDRDGVINQDSAGYVKAPEEWQPIAGSIEAMAHLYHLGWRMVIVSNQSAIGRGLMTLDALHRIHITMQNLLNERGARVEALFFCPHTPTSRCRCRKPKPGLLHQVTRRFQIDLRGKWFIGDTLKDVQAAQAVGAKPVLVRTGQGETTAKDPNLPDDVMICGNLSEAVDRLLDQTA